MANEAAPDYYEALQVSCTAEPETIHRVYRLLAQRLYPDNQASGDVGRFRRLTEAYEVLSDPERRAQYDIVYYQTRQQRWQVAEETVRSENDFEIEQMLRLTVLEVLYARRRLNPQGSGLFPSDLEDLLATPREHLEFSLWYLVQKGFAKTSDNSSLVITAEGVDHLEQSHQHASHRRRLAAHNTDRRPVGAETRVS